MDKQQRNFWRWFKFITRNRNIPIGLAMRWWNNYDVPMENHRVI